MGDGLQYYWDYFPSTMLFTDQYVWRREKALHPGSFQEAARLYATYWEPLLETESDDESLEEDTDGTDSWDSDDDTHVDVDEPGLTFIWDSFLDYADSVNTYVEGRSTADAVTRPHHVVQDLAEHTINDNKDDDGGDDDDDDGDTPFGVRLCTTY